VQKCRFGCPGVGRRIIGFDGVKPVSATVSADDVNDIVRHHCRGAASRGWQAGRKKEALALLQQLETTDPSLSSTHNYLATIYWEQKDYPRSLAERRHASELRHDEPGLTLASAREKGFAAGGLKGLHENELPVEKDLFDRGSGNAYALATTYAALGQRQEALTCLQTSFDRHEAAMLIGDPIPELQNDPEYPKFRAQVQEMLAR